MPTINITGSGAGGGKPPSGNDDTKALIAAIKKLDATIQKSMTGRTAGSTVKPPAPSVVAASADVIMADLRRQAEQDNKLFNMRKSAAQRESAKKEADQRKTAMQAEKLAQRESAKKEADQRKTAAREERMAQKAADRAERDSQRAYSRAYRSRNAGAAAAMAGEMAPEGAFRSPRALRAWQNYRSMGRAGQRAFAPGLGGSLMRAGGVAGATIGAAIEAPLLPGQIMNGILSTAQPAIDLTKGTYALGRAGGFSGAGLFNTLYPGTGTTRGTEWMTDNMLTAPKVLESMAQFGIAPRSAGQTKDMAIALAQAGLSGGFSGMGAGTVEKLARQGVGYGAAPNSAAGISAFLAPVEATLSDAVAKGMDRTKVLASIQDSLDLMARAGGIGASSNSALDLINKLMQSGTAGGRTGETAVGLQATGAAFARNPSSSPVAQLMIYSQLHKYGMLQDEKGVRAFWGDKINAVLDKTPAVRDRMIKDITRIARTTGAGAAMNAAIEAGDGIDPSRPKEIAYQGVREGGTPEEWQTTVRAHMFGDVTPDIYALDAGTAAGPATPEGRKSSPHFTETAAIYKAQLKNAGVPDDVAAALIAAGQAKNVNPMLLASIAKTESGFRQTDALGNPLYNKPKKGRKSSGAVGLMQVMPISGSGPSDWKYAAGARDNLELNAMEGADIFAKKLARRHDDIRGALHDYGGFDRVSDADYQKKVLRDFRGNEDRVNIPSKIADYENGASQKTIGGANFALNNFVPAAQKLTDGMEHAGDAVLAFAKKVESATKSFDAYQATRTTRGGIFEDGDVGRAQAMKWGLNTGSRANASPTPGGQ
jgi:hypothetical protein